MTNGKKNINAKQKKKELKCFCLRTRCVYDMPWHTKKRRRVSEQFTLNHFFFSPVCAYYIRLFCACASGYDVFYVICISLCNFFFSSFLHSLLSIHSFYLDGKLSLFFLREVSHIKWIA